MTAPVEAWLRGPVPGVPPLLVPAAHAIQHAVDDARAALQDLTPAQIWRKPGAASVGYHLCHLAGALDRLFTYARGESLSDEQRQALRVEADPGDPPRDADALAGLVAAAADRAIAQLRETDPATLLDARVVGRQRVPSTVLGLLVHGAEHAARHAGQAITTAKILRGG